MKKKRLLIIPAKSFSQRIKNKNFKKFYEKPIIEYSIDTAIKSRIFDKIHVSTEKISILNKLKKKKIIFDFLRDSRLTKKKIGLFEVYKFVVQEFKKRGLFFDEVWSLLPCSPLITVDDLFKLKKLLDKKKIKKPVISVAKYNAPVHWAFFMNKKNKMLTPFFSKKIHLPSQNFKMCYYDVGTLSVFNRKNLETKKKFFPGKFYGFELPPEKAVDIDEKDDWKFAEKLYKNSKKNS